MLLMPKKRDPKQSDSKTKPTGGELSFSMTRTLPGGKFPDREKTQVLVLWSVFLTVSH